MSEKLLLRNIARSFSNTSDFLMKRATLLRSGTLKLKLELNNGRSFPRLAAIDIDTNPDKKFHFS